MSVSDIAKNEGAVGMSDHPYLRHTMFQVVAVGIRDHRVSSTAYISKGQWE